MRRFSRPVRYAWKRGSSTIAPTRASATCARPAPAARAATRPRRRLGQPEQHPDQRGLAGAVRTEVAERGAARDAQLDVVDRGPVAEALGETGGLDRECWSPCRDGNACRRSGASMVSPRARGRSPAGALVPTERRAGPHEPGLVGEHDGLDAVAQAELAQHARDVRLDGRLAQEQPLGQLRVRQAAGEQLEDLELALGERRELGRRRLRPAARQRVARSDRAAGA